MEAAWRGPAVTLIADGSPTGQVLVNAPIGGFGPVASVTIDAGYVEILDISRDPLLRAKHLGQPIETSVRALAALKRDGLIDGIGLSNVTVGQIEEARRLAPIAAVQVELSVVFESIEHPREPRT